MTSIAPSLFHAQSVLAYESDYEEVTEEEPISSEMTQKSRALCRQIEKELSSHNTPIQELLDALQALVVMQTLLESELPHDAESEIVKLQELRGRISQEIKSKTEGKPTESKPSESLGSTCWRAVTHPLVLGTAASLAMPIVIDRLREIYPWIPLHFAIEDER